MKTNRNLIISGIFFTIILILWPVMMLLSRPGGTEFEHFNWIMEHLFLYKLQFFLAFLIAPALIYLMAVQQGKLRPGDSMITWTGWAFLAGYLVLNSLSYASQIILIPQLLTNGLTEQARLWYFGFPFSATYFMNQLGYCFWAIGTFILFLRRIREGGMIKYISGLYALSAGLSVVAFAGLLAGSPALNSLTLFSGLILLPVGIMTITWGVREGRKVE